MPATLRTARVRRLRPQGGNRARRRRQAPPWV